MQSRRVHHHAEFLQIMRVTELMQREGLIAAPKVVAKPGMGAPRPAFA